MEHNQWIYCGIDEAKLGSITFGTISNGESGEVYLSEPFGFEPNDDTSGVEEAGVVRITINNGVAPERRRYLWPEDDSYILTKSEEAFGVVTIFRSSGEMEISLQVAV